MILINGESCELRAGETILSALAHLEVEPQAGGIAVAVDGEVVPRAAWPSYELGEDARVEVLTAMQGG